MISVRGLLLVKHQWPGKRQLSTSRCHHKNLLMLNGPRRPCHFVQIPNRTLPQRH
jgi:hypothetical protein